MKRLIALCSLVIMTVAFALSAQAQVFKPDSNYKIKFDGFQYAYSGADNHNAFMSGQTTLESNLYDKATGAVKSGYNMTSIVWASHINTTDAPGKEPANYPPVYTDDGIKKGIYVGILSDLYTHHVDGDAHNGGTAFFTGGTLNWYYFEDLTTTDMSTLAYVPGQGLVFGSNYPERTTLDGQVFDTSAFTNENFAQFGLAGKNGWSGSADLEESSGEDLIVKTTFYGNAPDGSLFDSNKYGENENYDLKFTANLTWNDQTNRFSVDDPAYVSTPAAATPEPGTIALMAIGLLLTGYFVRQRSGTC
jgi:PEP-CTERM putative exosortase interaction domain